MVPGRGGRGQAGGRGRGVTSIRGGRGSRQAGGGRGGGQGVGVVERGGRGGDMPSAVIEGFSQLAGPARAAGDQTRPSLRGDLSGGRGVGRGASGPQERLSAEEILRPGDRRHEAAGVGRGRGLQAGRGGGGQGGQADGRHEAVGLAGRGQGGGGREEREVRARAWAFTINNYRDVPRDLPANAKYLCFGREESSTGTKHLQGYVVFKYAVKQPSRFFQNCGRGHFEVAKKSAELNIEYCAKSGDFVEYGDRPGIPKDQGHHGSKGGAVEVKRWDDAWNSAKKGNIEEIPGDIKLRYYSTITKVAAKYAKPPPELEKLDNIWIVGPSGTGKSTYIHREYPGAYKKGRLHKKK